mgnify:CR=1 FL=1
MYKSIIGVVVVLITTLVFMGGPDKDYKDLKRQLKSSLITYDPDKELISFSLIDHDNNKFNNNRLKDKWTLLMFIYTHCPDVCPTELLNMSLLRSTLSNDKSKVVPEVVSITFDPVRDTPKVLKTYTAYFDKSFIGVSGDQNQIDKLVKTFGAYYERVIKNEKGQDVILQAGESLPEGAIEEGYIINHTAQIYLVSPNGQIFAEFPAPHNISNMADDINLIIENY